MSWGAVAGAAAGAGLDWLTQNDTNAKNKQMMNKQNSWTEKMSNSAHQREVADLRAAGLNPMLAMGGSGASTPNSASAVYHSADVGRDVGNVVSTALESKRLKKDVELAESQLEMNKQNKQTSEAQMYLASQQGAKTYTESKTAQLNLEALEANKELVKKAVGDEAKARSAVAMNDKVQAEISKKAATYDAIAHRVKDAIGSVNSAASILKPKIQIGPSSYTDEEYSSTGEMIHAKSRRYHKD